MDSEERSGKGALYQIRVRGKLDAAWADWFDGLAVDYVLHGDGSASTSLTGHFDQAALRSLLARLWDLNLVLLEVKREEQREESDGKHS
ncbi:MAG: hypothetical protein PVF47_02045 [Anaerolineae bacterium]|jgi:hypothetical protein